MCAHVCAILLEVDSQSQPPPPPCINLLQTKTKRIQRRGFSACLFFFFQGCQPLLFKDLTLALQSNKNLFGKLIRLCKLFRFLMQLCVKSSIFHSLAMGSWQMCLLVSSQWPKAFCWSRCKRGGGAVGFSSWGLLLLRKNMWRLQLYVLSQEFHFSRTFCGCPFSIISVSGMRTFLLKWIWRVRSRKVRFRV